jgi:predicted translin family RNA/ssDNA-binding protein
MEADMGKERELTAERLEKELEEAEEKLERTERLIETVERELRPWEEEYEAGGNCCEDHDDEEEAR